LRRALIELSLRLGVVVTELEKLPVGTICEYLAVLIDSGKGQEEKQSPRAGGGENVVEDLWTIFGGPNGRSR